MSDILLVTPKEVKAQSQLGGNIDSEKLKIPIRTTQDLKVRPILGAALYDKIEELFVAGSGTITLEPYKTLYERYMRIVIILYTAAKFVRQTPLEVANGGSTTYEPSNGQSASRTNVIAQAAYIESDAETYAALMVDYLDANTDIFPEYSEIIDGDVEADSNVYFSGMELDGDNNDVRCLNQTGDWIRR